MTLEQLNHELEIAGQSLQNALLLAEKLGSAGGDLVAVITKALDAVDHISNPPED